MNISSDHVFRQGALRIVYSSIFGQRVQEVIKMQVINDSGVMGDTH
ncbi:MAG: hypothetical protein OSB44_08020 [Verrucomicrobiales bacterium]|nr:hypothetical protein [Verrucomicrobiales bacterium]